MQNFKKITENKKKFCPQEQKVGKSRRLDTLEGWQAEGGEVSKVSSSLKHGSVRILLRVFFKAKKRDFSPSKAKRWKHAKLSCFCEHNRHKNLFNHRPVSQRNKTVGCFVWLGVVQFWQVLGALSKRRDHLLISVILLRLHALTLLHNDLLTHNYRSTRYYLFLRDVWLIHFLLRSLWKRRQVVLEQTVVQAWRPLVARALLPCLSPSNFWSSHKSRCHPPPVMMGHPHKHVTPQQMCPPPQRRWWQRRSLAFGAKSLSGSSVKLDCKIGAYWSKWRRLFSQERHVLSSWQLLE